MLRKFDVELLIGIVSYKQKAEIYNVSNGYDVARKERQGRLSKPADDQACEESPSVSEQCG